MLRLSTRLVGAPLLVAGLVGWVAAAPAGYAATPHAAAQSQLWVARYDGSGGLDRAAADVVTPDGKIAIVTGTSFANSGYDYATVAYNTTTGAQTWVARYSEHEFGDNSATAAVVTPDSKTVIVTGEGALGHYATLAYNTATGAKKWLARYKGPSVSSATALAITPDGNTVIVTGRSENKGGRDDYATVAYDAATGAQKWVTRYGGTYDDDPTAAAVTPDGNHVIVTGWSHDKSGVNVDYATVAYDTATGTQEWIARYSGHNFEPNDRANAVTVTPDGNTVIVTGQSCHRNASNRELDYATIAYDTATGTQKWVARYDASKNLYNDVAYAVKVTPDGNTAIVTGQSIGKTGDHDYATVAYDTATGTQKWVARYTSAGASTATALSITPDGNTAVVTGASIGTSGNNDYATVAYNAATGAQSWVARYDGPGHGDDEATAAAITPDGKTVIATGWSVGTSGDDDYATVAYPT